MDIIGNSHHLRIDKDKMKFEIDVNARLESYNELYCDGVDCAWCCDTECRRWKHE